MALALVTPGVCFHQVAQAEHAHHAEHSHDNIDDEPVAEHSHTHRHSPNEPEHSHDHSHQLPASAGLDFYSLFFLQGVSLLPPPAVKIQYRLDIFNVSKSVLTAIFRPPIA
jgi:hypothetical protein